MSDTITITGNIAADPEGKRTAAGVAITTFRIASTHRRFDRAEGRWIDDYTNWYAVSAFRGLAEHALRSLHKGDRVVLTGRLRIRDWETTTARGTSVEITAESIGHDLLWGTTEFRRALGSAPGDSAPAEAAGDDAWAVPAADANGDGQAERGDARLGWGAHVSDAGGAGETPADGSEHPRELVGVDTPY